MRRAACLAGTLATLTGAAVGCGSTARTGSHPGAPVVTLGGVQTGVAPGPTAGSFGQISYRYKLRDSAGRTAGVEDVLCTGSPGQDAATCARTLVLRRGRISAQGVMRGAPGTGTLAVVGGTGVYAGLVGTMDVTGRAGRERIVVRRAVNPSGAATMKLRATRTASASGPTSSDPNSAKFIQLAYTGTLGEGSGKSLGRDDGACTSSPRKGVTYCLVALRLRQGNLVAEGELAAGARTLAVVGGTGAYVGARGSLTTTPRGAGRDDILVHLR
jgi:hypothetical protein